MIATTRVMSLMKMLPGDIAQGWSSCEAEVFFVQNENTSRLFDFLPQLFLLSALGVPRKAAHLALNGRKSGALASLWLKTGLGAPRAAPLSSAPSPWTCSSARSPWTSAWLERSTCSSDCSGWTPELLFLKVPIFEFRPKKTSLVSPRMDEPDRSNSKVPVFLN